MSSAVGSCLNGGFSGHNGATAVGSVARPQGRAGGDRAVGAEVFLLLIFCLRIMRIMRIMKTSQIKERRIER